jgi:thiol:disulfide interchange protein
MALLSRSLTVVVVISVMGCSRRGTDELEVHRESSTSTNPATVAASDETARSTQPSIYDESADGFQQIADALTTSKENHQRVLLQYGANWCGWCHRLHRLFETDQDIANKLKADYVVVLIDVNGEHNKDVDEKYGQPTRFGLPAIVILNAQGNQLTT